MKRISLSFMLLLSTITMFAYDFEVDGVYYRITSKEKLECEVTHNGETDYKGIPLGESYSGIVYINSKVTYKSKEYTVTGIGEYAFFFSNNLKNVVIPNSVKTIGNYAFNYCPGLTSINIPNSVTTIGRNVFGECFYLTKITVDPSNKTYDSRNDCNAIVETSSNTIIRGCRNTIIPNSVTNIGEYAFDGCNLTSINIPNSVTNIGKHAFSICALTSINIPNSITTIEEGAFFACNLLTSINIPNSVTMIEEGAFSSCSSLTSINIPNSLTYIGAHSFYGCSALTSVNIPNSVTSIGKEAFKYCTNLTSITIPNSVTSIERDAFSGCSNLTNIFVDPSNYIYDSRYNCNAIIETSSNTIIRGCQNTIFPNSVTNIGEYAFHGCNLTSINIPSSVITIGNGAFYSCSSLTSINIPNSVTNIGEYAFMNCSDLTSVNIPNSVTNIGKEAFCFCYNLTSITNLATTPQSIDYNTFSIHGTLHVYEGYKELYAKADNWKFFKIVDDIPLPTPCATPIIAYENGKVTYRCETEDAECHTSLSCSGLSLSLQSDNIVVINGQFTISVYATAEGYLQSETATKTITLENIPLGESRDSDGTITIDDITDLINRYLQQE